MAVTKLPETIPMSKFLRVFVKPLPLNYYAVWLATIYHENYASRDNVYKDAGYAIELINGCRFNLTKEQCEQLAQRFREELGLIDDNFVGEGI